MKADNDQGKADMMGAGKPFEGSKLNPKMDKPQAGKSVKNYAEASSGTTGSSAMPCDALGDPERFKRNESTVASETSKEELVKLREKQLGTNGYQAN